MSQSQVHRAKKRSNVWLHFQDLGDSKASCNYCSKSLSYKGGTTYNLFRHLMKTHPSFSSDVVILSEENVDSGDNVTAIEEELITPDLPPPATHSQKRSSTWLYYTSLTPTKARCNFCYKTISHSEGTTSNLNRHVKCVHPQIEVVTVTDDVTSSEFEEEELQFSATPPSGADPNNSKRSAAWLFFTQIDRCKAECTYCKKLVSCSGGSTSNLVRHLKAKHDYSRDKIEMKSPRSAPNNNKEVKEKCEQLEEAAAFTSKTPRKEQAVKPKAPINSIVSVASPAVCKKPQDIDVSLVEALTKNFLAFDIVENVHFKRFVKRLNPLYRMPALGHLTDYLVPRMCTAIKERMRKSLATVPAVSLSVETWKSVLQENFLALSVHYIDNDCRLRSHILECFEYVDSCTYDDLAQELKRIVHDWSLDERIAAVITDNVDILVNACGCTGWSHLPCFAQNINWIVKNALNEINEVYCKVKEIIDFFLINPEAADKLKSTQIEMDLITLNPKEDTLTTWNSTYDMFHRFNEIKDPLLSTIVTYYPDLELLNDDEFRIVSLLCEVLKVFRDVGEEISAEKQVSASKIILLTQALRNWCTTFLNRPNLPDEVTNFCNKLLEGIEGQFDSLEKNGIFAEATLLDPRFKHCGFTSSKCLQVAKESLIEKVSEIVPKGVTEVGEDVINVSTVWKDFDFTVKNIVQAPDPIAAATIEMEKYLEEPLLPRQRDPLVWWEARKGIYPELFQLARRDLCVVATASPCDLIFSEAGQEIIRQRNCLTGSRTPQIVFLNGNL